jgi:hypothetical protein
MSSEQGEIESVSAFFNKLEPVSYILRRVNTSKGRYYVVDDKMFISVTSLIDLTTKTDEGLIRKMCDAGYNEWMKFLNERATYGTIMHIMIADFLHKETLNFNTIDAEIDEIFSEHRVDRRKASYWREDLKRDLLAFATFASEYSIRPIAAELPLVSFEYKFAGTLDLLCWMTIKEKGFFGEVYKSGANKGEPKESYNHREILALIDFKSGRNGFTEKHADQLALCKILVEENYPDLRFYDMSVYNWAPKNWMQIPSFTLKDQTGLVPDSVIKSKIIIAQDKIKDTIPTTLRVHGTIALGDNPASNYQFKRIV